MAWSTRRKNTERDVLARIDPVVLWVERHVKVQHVVAWVGVSLFAVLCIVVDGAIQRM